MPIMWLPILLFAVLCMAVTLALTETRDNELNIILIGDWGGHSKAPHTTLGQLATRDVMSAVAEKHSINAIIGLGDNIYYHGVRNEYDERFIHSFENVYSTSSLIDIPWFLVAGNHDYHGNVSAQIAYSKHSQRWNFHDYYYTKTWKLNVVPPSADADADANGNADPNANAGAKNLITLQFIGLDTYIFCGLAEDQYVTTDCVPPNASEAEKQYEWLRNELRASNATYIIVAAHVPIFSYDFHGPMEQLIDNLHPILTNSEQNIIAYIAAHEHILEFIQVPQQNMQYVVSGAGNGCRGPLHTWIDSPFNPNPELSYKYFGCNRGGFVRLAVNENFAQMHYYLGNSSHIVYETGKWFANMEYLPNDAQTENENENETDSYRSIASDDEQHVLLYGTQIISDANQAFGEQQSIDFIAIADA